MRVLGVLALLAVVVTLLFVFLNWYVAPTKSSEKKDLVLALAQILGGTALLSGLYFTWRTLQVNREGQITERFTKAIDQLGKTDEGGNKLFEIRLGGIYALERITRESEKDHWPIMEVLTAYVRQHAPWPPEEGQQGEENAPVEKPVEYPEGSSQVSEPTKVPTLDPDIQAIMTVIRRRTRSFRYGLPEPLDLHRTNLEQANLTGADLTGAILWEAILREAHLEGADLTGAHLEAADLTGAHLEGANLTRADLSRANLTEADLTEADLTEADLTEANLTEADLTEADIRGADLSEAHLGPSGASHLEAARGHKGTLIPDGYERPERWED